MIRRGLWIPAKAMRWKASASAGPGGQHVNKTATRVELLVDLRQLGHFPPGSLARLRARSDLRFGRGGELQIVEGSERSQHANLKRARARVQRIFEAALIIPKRRRATQPTRGSVRRRLEAKQRKSALKKSRRGNYDEG